MTSERISIKHLTLDELKAKLDTMGLKGYRAGQIISWIYQQYAVSFEEMTNIAKVERDRLAAVFSLTVPSLLQTERSSDGTRKFLFGLEDGHTIESVLIPDDDRQTLCISSQVGCQQACRFCLTGQGGFTRNLAFFEIAGQVLEVSRILKNEGSRGITNIVLMGMGEPLANFEEVLKAIRIITSDRALGISGRRLTLSTDGLVPEMDALGRAGAKVNLAVSLNATTDETRDRIMPVNRRYPLKELLAACRRFPLEPRRRITFEYVLLRGVNDSGDDALRLARLLKGIKCKVNLIPFNPFPGSEFKRPDDAAVKRFQKILQDHHYTALVRESRGRDISAACGQLRERAAAAGSD
ncbi:MAG: 23S rRNA (adenine(2503)-C(2))-methyltransferase RlmN [Nitrospirota bacterium]